MVVPSARAISADGSSQDPKVLLDPIPRLTGRSSEISAEVLLLDAVDDAIIDQVFDRMVDQFPRLSRMTSFQQVRTREGLRWMARFTAAALLTNDATIVEDLLNWLCRLLHGEVPAFAIPTSAQLLADMFTWRTPQGATILRRPPPR